MAATDIQYGTARIFGIQGSYTVAIVSGYAPSSVSLTGADTNPSSIAFNHSFKTDEIASVNGAVIETLIASQQRREITIEIIPSSTSTSPTRAEALVMLEAIGNLSPFAIFTLASFDFTKLNGTWNYMGGAECTLKRDTYAICSIKLAQFEVAGTAGTYAALPIAS